jgi:hypothetical protein
LFLIKRWERNCDGRVLGKNKRRAGLAYLEPLANSPKIRRESKVLFQSIQMSK